METVELCKQITDSIGGRRVIYALFTTYCLEPDFFELEVLPLLFDSTFSPDPKLRRFQLSRRLREVSGIELYYDYGAFDAAESCHLDYQRIPISNGVSAFHPKLALLLVHDEETSPSLIVLSGSANLTRAGYWENLECFHIEEFTAATSTPLRSGLLAFMNLLRRLDRTRANDGQRQAWSTIKQFLLKLPSSRESRWLAFYSAPWSFPDFLQHMLGPRRGPWTVEIISPFFAQDPVSCVGQMLRKNLNISEIRLLLPCDDSGEALCSRQYYESMSARTDPPVKWCTLKDGELQKNGSGKNSVPRRVHAKVYRFYSRKLGEEYIFVGSVNFTARAFALDRRGGNYNIEAGFWVQTDTSFQPLLKPLDQEQTRFAAQLELPPGEAETAPLAALAYDWRTGSLSFFMESGERGLVLEIGDERGELARPTSNGQGAQWQNVQLTEELRERLEKRLRQTSFLSFKIGSGEARWLIVQESGMSVKPSQVVEEMSPTQIMQLWATLDPEEQQSLLERLMRELQPKEISSEYRQQVMPDVDGSFFSQFSQVFQSFRSLHRHLKNALADGNQRDLEYYLLGQEIDSLPRLLAAVKRDDHGCPPYLKFMVGLAAREVVELHTSRPEIQELMDQNRHGAEALKAAIGALEDEAGRLDLGPYEGQRQQFLAWFKNAFFMPMRKGNASGGQ